MDGDWLAARLREGLSLARIGNLVGKDPSTIGYWVAKYGLTANGTQRHAARGTLDVEVLKTLVEEGLTTREIARRVDRSQATVRHWLRRYGLKTARSVPARASGERGADPLRRMMHCEHHGDTEFWLEGRGIYRCLRCRSEAVSRRRRKVKEILVDEAGGRCSRCGYDRWIGALHFHHVDSAAKRFGLADRGFTRSLAAVREEAAKCVLLCSNCHAEVEAGILDIHGGAC
jgi:DNA-binding transcriptional ArsR family regulator